MRTVNEIFYSLQGEGVHTGVPMVFVRFAGCNLHCPFCDTQHQAGVALTDQEIIEEIMKYPQAQWIVLTGGEPTLQIDNDFVNNLKRHTGKKIAIETNGTHPVPEAIDWVTVSPKGGIAPELSSYDQQMLVKKADEIKVVETGQDISLYFNLPCHTQDTVMCLQPCFVPDADVYRDNIRRTIRRVLEDPRWRLSVQTHRYLNIP